MPTKLKPKYARRPSSSSSSSSITKNKPTLIAFLLDRSGSMTACKQETITGFNAYITELRKKETGNARFTFTQFDSQGIDIIHHAVPLKTVTPLNADTYQPRASTPLYDAIGQTIRATAKQAGEKFKVLFVILTDGAENSSSEWNHTSAKKLIKEMEDQNKWTFAYIGTGLDGFTATQAIASGTQSAGNVLRSSHGKTGRAYGKLAGASVSYMSSTKSGQTVDAAFWGSTNATTEDDIKS